MLKSLALRYWPIAVLGVLVIAILTMSRYAENRKASAPGHTEPCSPTATVAPYDAYKATNDTGKPQNPPSWIDTFAWPEGATVWALLLTLFVIAWQSAETREAARASLKSVKVMERQADLMEDTAKRQLRAYVGLTETAVKFTDDGKLEAQMFFKNGGQTPAYDVRSWVYPMVDDYPLTYDIGHPPVEMPLAVGIIPSQEQQIMVAPGLVLPQEIIDRLSRRDFAFYVIGEVNYRDIFKDRHILKYRLVFGGPAGTRTTKDTNGIKLGMLCMDIQGNEEDDEPRYRYPRPNPN